MVTNVRFGTGMIHEREVISVKSKVDDAKLLGHNPKT